MPTVFSAKGVQEMINYSQRNIDRTSTRVYRSVCPSWSALVDPYRTLWPYWDPGTNPSPHVFTVYQTSTAALFYQKTENQKGTNGPRTPGGPPRYQR